jgi:hypothetical protein
MGNRNRDLPAYNIIFQPTTLRRVSGQNMYEGIILTLAVSRKFIYNYVYTDITSNHILLKCSKNEQIINSRRFHFSSVI